VIDTAMKMQRLVVAVAACTVALTTSGCGDAPGFAVWAEGQPARPVVIVLSARSLLPIPGEESFAYVVDKAELRQSTSVPFRADPETSEATIAVFTPACRLIGRQTVSTGEYRVTVEADGTFAGTSFAASGSRGPVDAPDLEPARTDCGSRE
jgi:hypothetical protein